MVTTIPSVFMGGAASGPDQAFTEQAVGDTAAGAAPPEVQMAPEAPAASAESGPAAAMPAPSSAPSAAVEAIPQPTGETGIERQGDDGQVFYGSETSPPPGEPDGGDLNITNQVTEGPITRTTTMVLAGTLLLIGLLLFGLRWTARRLGDG
jgi:hypothetical protein